MAREDDMLKQWFDVLRIMQDCAANLSHRTLSDLQSFYSQKHGEVLTGDDLRQNFASCFFSKTGFSVTDGDFAKAGSFHELLDCAFRYLRISVRAVFRLEGIMNDRVPSTTDPAFFETFETTTVYTTDAERQKLVARLAAGMPTLTTGRQADLLLLLAKAGTTSGRAMDSIL
jgi:hypothetical protein